MSKSLEEKNEQKTNPRSIPSMSSRQQILYLIKESQNTTNKEEEEESEKKEVLDYCTYFMKRKEKIRAALPRESALQRAKYLKQSFKEFTHIKKNIYIDRKKYVFSDDDAYLCNCEKKGVCTDSVDNLMDEIYEQKKEDDFFGCGKKCINKLVSAECVEHLCPCGASCKNRKFQQHLYSEVYPVCTEDRGWGLCAGEFLPKGTFVMQYIGEIYSIDSSYGLSKLKEYKGKTCTYLMEISKKEVIDPTTKGNLARFINHSCEPNCETQKWHVLGEVCVGVFTLRDINEGEELTFNYGFNILKTTFQKCLCGTKSCKGYLGVVSQNEQPHGANHSIACNLCKVDCKNSEKVLVCENCKKVSHKNCVKVLKEKLEANNNSLAENWGFLTNKNKDKDKDVVNIYVCYTCLKKKKDYNNNVTNVHSSSNEKYQNKSNTNIDKNNNINIINTPLVYEMNNLIIDEGSKDKQEKKSSQQLIKEYRSRKKYMTNFEQLISESIVEIDEEINSNSPDKKETVVALPAPKKEKSKVLQIPIPPESPKTQTIKIPIDENEITETVEVEEAVLQRIKKSLGSLSTIGARLFWDYRQQSNTQKIEVKITGTAKQIATLKNQINKFKNLTDPALENFSVNVYVPQIFVRKIIGHQNRNLLTYYAKYRVTINFSNNYISDDIFPITDYTYLTIHGRETPVKLVESEIKCIVDNLKVVTVYLMTTDYNLIKNNICQLKTMIDPADMRLRKRELKNEKEIKHNFYYIPSSNKDLVIIGNSEEILKAQKIINEFLLRQNTLEPNYSVCFLCPVFFLNQVNRFQDENESLIRKKNLLIKVIDPLHSRKHLNIYIEGKWKDIIEIKNLLVKFLNENDRNSKKKNSYAEFIQYAFNQEHKLSSKHLKKYFLHENYMIKNWDLISDEIYQVWEGGIENNVLNLPGNNINNNFPINNSTQSALTTNYLMKNFLEYPNSDAILNYLLYLPPGSHESVFNINKLNITKDLIYYVDEAFQSYKKKRVKESNNENEQNFVESQKLIKYSPKGKDSPDGGGLDKEPQNYTVVKNEMSSNVENLTDDENEEVIPNIKSDVTLINNLSPKSILSQPPFQSKMQPSPIKSETNINNINNSLPGPISTTQYTSDIDKIKYTLLNKLNEFRKTDGNNTNNIQENAHNIINSINSPKMFNEMNNDPSSFPNTTNPNTLANNKNFTLQNLNILNTMGNLLGQSLTKINNLNTNKNSQIYNKEDEFEGYSKKSSNNFGNVNSNENSSIKKHQSDAESNAQTAANKYEIKVSPEQLNMLLKTNSQVPEITQPSLINSESMNISYNFSNINQMNININISSFPKDKKNEEKSESKKDTKFLRKKTRVENSLSPPYNRKSTSGFYNKNSPRYNDNKEEPNSKYNNNFKYRSFKDKSDNNIDNYNTSRNLPYKKSNYYDKSYYEKRSRMRSRSEKSKSCYEESDSQSVKNNYYRSYNNKLENKSRRGYENYEKLEKFDKFDKYETKYDKYETKYDTNNEKDTQSISLLNSLNNFTENIKNSKISEDGSISNYSFSKYSRSRSPISATSFVSNYDYNITKGYYKTGGGKSIKGYRRGFGNNFNNNNNSSAMGINLPQPRGYVRENQGNYNNTYASRNAHKHYGFQYRNLNRYDYKRNDFCEEYRRRDDSDGARSRLSRRSRRSRSPSVVNEKYMKEFLVLKNCEQDLGRDTKESKYTDKDGDERQIVQLMSSFKKPLL